MNKPIVKIPKIKPSFDKISYSVKNNIINLYRKNENNLRIYHDDKILKKEIENYFIEYDLFNNYTSFLINKEEYLIQIINGYLKNKDKDNDQLFNLLIEDYCIIFLENNLIKKKNNKVQKEIYIIDDNIKLLILMINLRNNSINNFLLKNENKNIIDKLAKSINWIESYREEIIILEKIYIKVNEYIPELYVEIQEIINKKKIQYNICENKHNYFSILYLIN